MEKPVSFRQAARQAFAHKLKQLMEAKGWHQSELARQAALPRHSVSVYLRGKSLPTSKNLRALADALSVPIDEFTEITPSMTPKFQAEFRTLSEDSSKAHVVVNGVLKLSTAIAIMGLVTDDQQVAD